MISNVLKVLCDQLLMILQVQLEPDMSLHDVIPPIPLFLISFVRLSVLYLKHQYYYFGINLTNFCILFPLEHGHRKSQQEFRVLQLDISFE